MLVRPQMFRAHVKVHTLLVFSALLGGAKAFGVIGIFVGPLVLSFALAIVELQGQQIFPAIPGGETPIDFHKSQR